MGALQRFKIWWEAIDRTQRVQVFVGAGFFFVLLAGVILYASKPKMELLFSGLTPQEYGPIVQELEAAGIQKEFTEKGDVLVPDKDKAKARMVLASKNKLPVTAHKGVDSLSGTSAFTTKTQMDAMLKSATEGELANSIQTLEGVQSALVHINFGKDGAFADQTTPATAVVNITEKAGANLGREQGTAIARLVQNSVNGLKAENVSVINSTGRFVYDGTQMGSTGNTATTKIEAQIAESSRRQRELQAVLDTAFGAGNTIAHIDVELDMDDKSESTESSKADTQPWKQVKVSETMQGKASSASGPSGIVSNPPGAPNTPPATQPNSSDYAQIGSDVEHPVTTKRESIRRASGNVTAMTVNVLANKTAVKDLEAVKTFVKDTLGPKYGEDNFKASVTETEFDTTAFAASKKAADAAASAAKMQQIFSILPIAALVIVAFMVVKAIAKAAPKSIMVDAALPMGGGSLPMSFTKSHESHSGGGALPSSSHSASKVTDLLGAVDIEEEEDENDPVRVGNIRAKVDVPLEQIRKMAQQRPDAIATLLKSWMLEDRR